MYRVATWIGGATPLLALLCATHFNEAQTCLQRDQIRVRSGDRTHNTGRLGMANNYPPGVTGAMIDALCEDESRLCQECGGEFEFHNGWSECRCGTFGEEKPQED